MKTKPHARVAALNGNAPTPPLRAYSIVSLLINAGALLNHVKNNPPLVGIFFIFYSHLLSVNPKRHRAKVYFGFR